MRGRGSNKGSSNKGGDRRRHVPYTPAPVAPRVDRNRDVYTPQSSSQSSYAPQSSFKSSHRGGHDCPRCPPKPSAESLIAVNMMKNVQFPFPLRNLCLTEETVKKSFSTLQNVPLTITSHSVNPEEFVDKHLTEEKQFLFDPNVFANGIDVYTKAPSDYIERDWISDFFIEHSRLQAKRPHKTKTGRSPFEEWNLYGDYVARAVDSTMKKMGISNPHTLAKMVCDDLNPSAIHHIREELFSDKTVQECASESPSFIRNIIMKLTDTRPIEEIRIFDACAGWGDRLIAAMSLGVGEYTGIEPNTNSISAFREMISLFGDERYRVLPLSMPTEYHAEYHTERHSDYQVANHYDIAFFSPPSFDTEVYSPDVDQSILKFPTRGAWVDGFLVPSLCELVHRIRPGGFLVVQSILIHLIHPLIERHFGDEMKATSPVFCNEQKKFRYKPLWVYRKRSDDKMNWSTVSNVMPLIAVDFELPTDTIVVECLKCVNLSVERLYPYNTHTFHIAPGFRIQDDTKLKIAMLRYEVWKHASTINPLFDSYNPHELHESTAKMWLDDNEHEYLHLFITDQIGDVIAACRIRFHRTLSSIAGCHWLSDYRSPHPLFTKFTGGVMTIERLVVDPRYSRSIISQGPSKGMVYGGGIARMMDTFSIVLAKTLGAGAVWCDVPRYRIDILSKMGFSSDHFVSKTSAGSRTPEIEWHGMLLDLGMYASKRGRYAFYHNHSGYTFNLSFRNLSDIPTGFNPKTFLISGNSGLNKNALRRVLTKNGYIEYDEAYFVSNALKHTIDFLSLEWDSNAGSTLNPYFYEITSNTKNVVDDACIAPITNKMMLHTTRSPFLADTTPLSVVKNVTHPMIIRPVGKNACSGNDVYVVTNNKELAEVKKYFSSSIHPRKYESVIASKYITSPMTFDEKKMHIRMYLLVRSNVDRGEGLFLFHLGKILTSSEKYTMSNYSILPGKIQNKSIHDTHADTTECNLWFPYDLPWYDTDEMYFKMRKVCDEVIVPKLKGNIKSYTESVNAYEVLGLDFMFDTTSDTSHNPILIEVNTKVGFSTLREPTEVGRSYSIDNSHLSDMGNVNILSQETVTPTTLRNTVLTFGGFSELMYDWIYRTSIQTS